ncbi:MAG: hypothetical protein IIU39_03205 [Ruminococcus sp.]|jgi:signal transduction histidine kinase|nr:hypothetical protein [Ruminococcus sp.]
MDKDIATLESENKRLINTLRKARNQLGELQKTLDSLSDLLEERNEGHVTEDDVKNLLKKYSGL